MRLIVMLFLLPLMLPCILIGGVFEIAQGAFFIGKDSIRSLLDRMED
jgi:hypothetical protein